MEAKSVASNGIVHEVLTKDNYKRWKTLMKNYLLGQDLWVVVENASEVADEVSRRMNNAKALHIIQLSCGPGILDEISHFETAKEAWNYLSAQYGKELKAKRDTEQAKEAWVHLSARYGRELKATPDIEQGLLMDDSLRECKELHRQVEGGNWDAAYLSISEDREAIFSASASGRTVLHVAVIAGHVKIVDKLVKLGKDKLVEMKDKEGYTALALAAHYTGNTKIAKCMVEKEGGVREDLLAMENKHREIPVLLAAANGHKEMTRYLYSKTPREVLDGEDSRNRLLLLSRCITADIFDVALRLLQRYPQLARESLLSDECSALHALANMPSAFPSGRHRSELLHQHYYRSKLSHLFFLSC
ncbi:ankyrin repeat-containing protein ITN1-like [Gastrolobium bilobum]|uniref:ankyrin repeat-containing protein ITN1-like n=1 Tax=Gastrolobium bilobum TaxID=150636 RepID=UPI002AB11DB2|nr:ankyrin repeat-containing protein ITN1-like [Gastrolobium bilobum]